MFHVPDFINSLQPGPAGWPAESSRPASFPDVSLAAKGVGAQGMKGRGKDAIRLADFVFKMAECSIADDYAIFKKEHKPVCLTNFEKSHTL